MNNDRNGKFWQRGACRSFFESIASALVTRGNSAKHAGRLGSFRGARLFRSGTAFLFTFFVFATAARATYHTYRIEEVYSNSSGTIQFIEMQEVFGLNGQNLISEAPDIRSGSKDFVFSINLPSTTTAHTDFLLATPGFEALPGAPTADYIIPSSFFNPAGDTLQYGSTGPDGVVDLTTFTAVPTDPSQSLTRVGTSGNNYTTTAAVAHTFSGATFAVPEPSSAVLILTSAALLLAIAGRTRRQVAR